MKIKITETAIEDIYNGRIFYENQAPGIGEYFFKTIFNEIDSLLQNHGIHPIFFGFHRMLSKKFPFAVYYKNEKEFIIIYRILDMRKNPKKINGDMANFK
ncbi:MAG: type II toxin-antitoxin system RelE/ParE family toxin [Spirochaetes bacterium]|nr:type II toxin-antitoxin system RelE/ParE family toxin [Spirochaetota bacterium]